MVHGKRNIQVFCMTNDVVPADLVFSNFPKVLPVFFSAEQQRVFNFHQKITSTKQSVNCIKYLETHKLGKTMQRMYGMNIKHLPTATDITHDISAVRNHKICNISVFLYFSLNVSHRTETSVILFWPLNEQSYYITPSDPPRENCSVWVSLRNMLLTSFISSRYFIYKIFKISLVRFDVTQFRNLWKWFYLLFVSVRQASNLHAKHT